jgi:hypothetical protein
MTLLKAWWWRSPARAMGEAHSSVTTSFVGKLSEGGAAGCRMILGMSIRDDFAEPIKRRMAAEWDIAVPILLAGGLHPVHIRVIPSRRSARELQPILLPPVPAVRGSILR